MNRSKDRPELYEVLRQMRAERTTGPAPAEPAARAPRVDREAAPITFGSPPFVTLQVSTAAGLVFAAIFVILIIAAFLLGSQMSKPGEGTSVGIDIMESPTDEALDAVPPPDDEAPRDLAGDAGATDTSEARYAVRVATVNADQFISAQRIVSILESETGEKPWVDPREKHIVVYIGRFGSPDDPELKRLEKQVQGIRQGRNTLFGDAYIVKLIPRRTSPEGESDVD